MAYPTRTRTTPRVQPLQILSLHDGMLNVRHLGIESVVNYSCIVTVSCENRQRLTMSLNWSVMEDLTHLEPENPSGHEKQ